MARLIGKPPRCDGSEKTLKRDLRATLSLVPTRSLPLETSMTDDDLETKQRRKEWGKRIRDLRKRLSKSRDDFGSKYGVTGKTIGRYENGEIAPKSDVFYRMLETARNRSFVWEFTGATLREIYAGMLEDPTLLPPKDEGILAYLEVELTEPTYFFEILDLVRPHALTLNRSGNPGRNSDGKVFVYLLFTIKDEFLLRTLCRELLGLEQVIRVADDYRPKEHKKRIWEK